MDGATDSLWEYKGQIGQMARNPNGSRRIQNKLESAHVTASELELICSELLPTAVPLMSNRFGNYVIQKVLERGTPEQRRDLIQQMRGHVVSLVFDQSGCRVVQKALQVGAVEEQVAVARELNGHELACVWDHNANHVMQKCFETIPLEEIHFLVSSFEPIAVELAAHSYGCRVLQRLIDAATHPEHYAIINPVLCDIVLHCNRLVRDQYGNYVVQHILQQGKPRPHHQHAVVQRLLELDDVVDLSCHKFASNVVERMFEAAHPDDRDTMVQQLLQAVPDILLDNYGNYVMQTILTNASARHLESLESAIGAHSDRLSRHDTGRHILGRLRKLRTMHEGGDQHQEHEEDDDEPPQQRRKFPRERDMDGY